MSSDNAVIGKLAVATKGIRKRPREDSGSSDDGGDFRGCRDSLFSYSIGSPPAGCQKPTRAPPNYFGNSADSSPWTRVAIGRALARVWGGVQIWTTFPPWVSMGAQLLLLLLELRPHLRLVLRIGSWWSNPLALPQKVSRIYRSLLRLTLSGLLSDKLLQLPKDDCDFLTLTLSKPASCDS